MRTSGGFYPRSRAGIRGRNITKGKRQGCSGYISSTQLLMKAGWVIGNQVRDEEFDHIVRVARYQGGLFR